MGCFYHKSNDVLQKKSILFTLTLFLWLKKEEGLKIDSKLSLAWKTAAKWFNVSSKEFLHHKFFCAESKKKADAKRTQKNINI